MSAAEKFAEELEVKQTGQRHLQGKPGDIDVINSGILRISALISKQTRAEEARNYDRVTAARPLSPPGRMLPERVVSPGAIEAAKVRAREVRIEINRITWPARTGEA